MPKPVPLLESEVLLGYDGLVAADFTKAYSLIPMMGMGVHTMFGNSVGHMVSERYLYLIFIYDSARMYYIKFPKEQEEMNLRLFHFQKGSWGSS